MLKKLLIGFVVLVVLIVMVAYILPGQYTVERSRTIKAPPEVVFSQVNDLHQWQHWSSWAERDPNMKVAYSGADAGEGAVQSWKSETEGEGRISFTKSDAPKYIAYDLAFTDVEMIARGDFTFSEADGGTKVVWTVAGDLGMNPIWRYFGLMMDGMVGADFARGLERLDAHCVALPQEPQASEPEVEQAAPAEEQEGENPPNEDGNQ